MSILSAKTRQTETKFYVIETHLTLFDNEKVTCVVAKVLFIGFKDNTSHLGDWRMRRGHIRVKITRNF